MTTDHRPAPCYRDRDNGIRFVKSGHRPDCADPDCRGCTPCPERWHCTASRNCSWHLQPGELTCGRCVGDVRRNLRWIGDLMALVFVQALADGVESQAANLAGPTADARDWRAFGLAQRHRITALLLADQITEARATKALEAMEADDEHHPERVSTTWALMIAEDYGHALPERLTLSWSLAYLERQLHRIANDDEQDFGLLKREVKKCRQHLEAVLHNDDQRDRGAPCPECVAAMQKVREDLEAREVPKEEWPRLKAPCLERIYALAQPHDRYDTWRCPKVREHEWSHHAYVAYVEDRRRGRMGA